MRVSTFKCLTAYCVEILDIQGLKGISIKKGDDLADILCRNREKHCEFRSLVISVYQGKKNRYAFRSWRFLNPDILC
jgi:hypothetical protein